MSTSAYQRRIVRQDVRPELTHLVIRDACQHQQQLVRHPLLNQHLLQPDTGDLKPHIERRAARRGRKRRKRPRAYATKRVKRRLALNEDGRLACAVVRPTRKGWSCHDDLLST